MRTFLRIASFGLVSFTSNALAQSTPSEFAELSFQALLDIDINENDTQQFSANKWSFSVQLKAAEFDGYKIDDSDISLDDVLFSPGEEPRTTNNFPVVPTIIDQYAKIVQLGYQVNEGLKLGIQVPFIHQETDHISVVPGYEHFVISSSGMGDIALSASYALEDNSDFSWWVTAGISLPTGSIDEQGDTPRDAGNQQLPYTMQLGSGTYDFPVEVSYQNKGEHAFTITLSAMLRTGTNDRNYRLGNNYKLSGKYNFPLSQSTALFTGVAFGYSESIHGQDDEITIGGNNPYPASITNPDLYGGEKVSVFGGISFVPIDWLKVVADVSKPVYQNLNGPQPQELWRAGLQLSVLY
ncbi:conserved exported hypothetical protein [Alteromonas sp. 38]|uniref:hypothetical protein n=1 Tax=unclassified Alteromonas TaxID=2614992 RepID=UPI0012EEFE9B|nr:MULTISPECIES: hypothetical protein [unclassified Alteromonas]CAD5272690.1 conserved exported hypothetical protein [Alteromonas sp. 154]VXB53427.1 conserved exported hypothetical protein [Alteromonas sp. 38]